MALGKIARVFPDEHGVIRTIEVEEGGQKSICSITFIVPLELDSETNAISQAEERDIETEEEGTSQDYHSHPSRVT